VNTLLLTNFAYFTQLLGLVNMKKELDIKNKLGIIIRTDGGVSIDVKNSRRRIAKKAGSFNKLKGER
jgi:hypothetical protein